jgi:oxygen-independent coproporphyrinogen-3 oxidase
MTRLERMLAGTPYAGYAYSYPHKTAYRPLAPPVPLRDLWADEPRDALFLYLHVPFCEMRCGFCNLFTTPHPKADLTSAYLDALRRQARRVREAMGLAAVARMAVGGGTPTYLNVPELHALFDIAADLFGARLGSIPISVETSPRTAEPERLRALRERGVTRVSIGVQSFLETEVAAIGRAQKTAEVERALERIRAAGIPTLNIDLMYGLPDQTVETWLASLCAALRFAPEELYLYPLYVRPLTGMDRLGKRTWDELRLDCYRAGRAFLREAGYAQVSMRMFRRPGRCLQPPSLAPASEKGESRGRSPVPLSGTGEGEGRVREGRANEGLLYCCQEDGMIGLGCGARSYTRRLHYSTEFAVGREGVRGILADYVARPDESFDVADYGTELDAEEQRRRYVIKSLLRAEGLDLAAYRAYFGSRALVDLPELAELALRGLAVRSPETLTLTEAGLERSDMIGPWLYSARMRQRMEGFELR